MSVVTLETLENKQNGFVETFSYSLTKNVWSEDVYSLKHFSFDSTAYQMNFY